MEGGEGVVYLDAIVLRVRGGRDVFCYVWSLGACSA